MAYRVHIRQFDGPLDLLLHLIGRAEIDIADIFVSEITQQYLSYMDQLDEVDMDTASDFLAMAATLLYIKSRHLLPRPPREERRTRRRTRSRRSSASCGNTRRSRRPAASCRRCCKARATASRACRRTCRCRRRAWS